MVDGEIVALMAGCTSTAASNRAAFELYSMTAGRGKVGCEMRRENSRGAFLGDGPGYGDGGVANPLEIALSQTTFPLSAVVAIEPTAVVQDVGVFACRAVAW